MPSLLFVVIIAYQGPYPPLGYKAQKNNLNVQFNKRKEIDTPPQFTFCLCGIIQSSRAREFGTKKAEYWLRDTTGSGILGWPEGKVSGVLRGGDLGCRCWRVKRRWEFVWVPVWLPSFSQWFMEAKSRAEHRDGDFPVVMTGKDLKESSRRAGRRMDLL